MCDEAWPRLCSIFLCITCPIALDTKQSSKHFLMIALLSLCSQTSTKCTCSKFHNLLSRLHGSFYTIFSYKSPKKLAKATKTTPPKNIFKCYSKCSLQETNSEIGRLKHYSCPVWFVWQKFVSLLQLYKSCFCAVLIVACGTVVSSCPLISF